MKHESVLKRWDKFSSIRGRPRRLLTLDINDQKYFYPIERQPLCVHPLVLARGKKILQEILIHSAYKFMLDIAYVEVQLINDMSLRIYNSDIDYNFPPALKRDMLSIIIDEAYHAYVALDYVDQVIVATGVANIYEPEQVELGRSIQKFKKILPQPAQAPFELIAICIGENTLTKELFGMTKQAELNPFFHQVISDHMLDEGRHSGIFKQAFKQTWDHLAEEIKVSIGNILPNFLLDYLDVDLHEEFNKKLLAHLNFSAEEIDTIILDTRTSIQANHMIKTNPVAKNIIDMFRSINVFSHTPTYQAFVNANLVKE